MTVIANYALAPEFSVEREHLDFLRQNSERYLAVKAPKAEGFSSHRACWQSWKFLVRSWLNDLLAVLCSCRCDMANLFPQNYCITNINNFSELDFIHNVHLVQFSLLSATWQCNDVTLQIYCPAKKSVVIFRRVQLPFFPWCQSSRLYLFTQSKLLFCA